MTDMQLFYEVNGDDLDVVLKVGRRTDEVYDSFEIELRAALGQMLKKQRFGPEDRVVSKLEPMGGYITDVHRHVYKGSAANLEALKNLGVDVMEGIGSKAKALIAMTAELNKSWDDIKTPDDVLTAGEREEIAELEKTVESTCPFLRKFGNFFYACGQMMPEGAEFEPEPSNSVYNAKQSLVSLQLYCWDKCEACVNYSGTDEVPMP